MEAPYKGNVRDLVLRTSGFHGMESKGETVL